MKKRFVEMQELLEQEEVVNGFHKQVQSLFQGAQEYWSYYCQYRELDKAQKTLQQYYKGGEETEDKISMLERLYIDFYWRQYQKKYSGQELRMKDFWESMDTLDEIAKILASNNIADAKKVAVSVYDSNDKFRLKLNNNPYLKDLHLDNIVEALSLLQNNQKVTMKDLDESFCAVYAPEIIDTLLNYAKADDKIWGQINFCFKAGDVRGTLYATEISNRIPNKLKSAPAKEIFYAQNFRENLTVLKEKIADILEKYPVIIIDDFIGDLETIEEIENEKSIYRSRLE